MESSTEIERGKKKKKKPTCDRKREGSSSSSSSYCLVWFGQRMNEELEEEQCKCINPSVSFCMSFILF